jgi:hypothetical protein
LNRIVGKLAERWVYGQGFTAENKAPQRLPKSPPPLLSRKQQQPARQTSPKNEVHRLYYANKIQCGAGEAFEAAGCLPIEQRATTKIGKI